MRLLCFIQEHDSHTTNENEVEGRFETVTTFMLQRLGFDSNHNAWACSDHWIFSKSKGRY